MTVTTTTEPGAPPRVPVVPVPATAERRPPRPRRRRSVLPYVLIAPTVIVLTVVLGYPVVRLIVQSGQEYGMAQVFGTPARWIGFDNFRHLFEDRYFWTVLRRTTVFCFVNVVLTMSLGVLVALLLNSLGSKMRLLVSTSLILAWAMPALTATVVWQWIFDSEYGLANWVFDRQGESWLADPMSFFGVATIIVVWMGIPFIAFTVYAGLSQVPADLLEAASLDGAGAVARFRYIVVPMLKPILMILTALSTLWDFRVFTQIYVLQQAGGISRDTNLLGVYTYQLSIGQSDYGAGAAAALLMIVLMCILTLGYLRSMFKQDHI
ncbi:MAG TPA: sugar ABC transporter permease [Ilumatobacteraceae bacterium]|nr:sugar ABC transporter permease [Ilumatobacteraceae bacterium]